MSRILLVCLLTGILYSSYSQTSLSINGDQYYYFDKEWNNCPKDSASYVRQVQADSNNNRVYILKDYYLSGQLHMRAKYMTFSDSVDWRNSNFSIKNHEAVIIDTCIWYHENGRMSTIAVYSFGYLNGPYINWYEDGRKKSAGRYLNGYKNGEWKYWTQGKEICATLKFKYGKRHGSTKAQFEYLGTSVPYLHFNGITIQKGDSRLIRHKSGTQKTKISFADGSRSNVYIVDPVRPVPNWEIGDVFVITEKTDITGKQGDSTFKNYHSQSKSRITVIKKYELGYILEHEFLRFEDNNPKTLQSFSELSPTMLFDNIRQQKILVWLSPFGELIKIVNKEEIEQVFLGIAEQKLIKENTIEYTSWTEVDTAKTNYQLNEIKERMESRDPVGKLVNLEMEFLFDIFRKNFFPRILLEQKITEEIENHSIKINRKVLTEESDNHSFLTIKEEVSSDGKRLSKLFESIYEKLASYYDINNIENKRISRASISTKNESTIDLTKGFVNTFHSNEHVNLNEVSVRVSKTVEIEAK